MENGQSLERVLLASTSQIRTLGIGTALSASLYKKDISVWLCGELGAGKTTLIQGLGLGLGIEEITSPTYAIENRYNDRLLHMDLYRLDEKEARRMVEESDEFQGIRAIEWFDKTGSRTSEENNILITIKETSETSREIEIIFNDIALPPRSEIESWRKDVKLPEHICKHCDAVGVLGKEYAEGLLKRGTVCRPKAIKAAGELHDLFRFVDFRSNGSYAPQEDELTKKHWKEVAAKYSGKGHEATCAAFLKERGFSEIAEIVHSHGLNALDEMESPLKTIEQKILFYADKRIMFDKIVSLNERFDDFVERYGDGVESDRAKKWRKKTKEVEVELFGNNIPLS